MDMSMLITLITNPDASFFCAANFSTWHPSEQEWSECCCRIEASEVARVHRFVYKNDAKAALAGRLLIRSFFREVWQLNSSKSNLKT